MAGTKCQVKRTFQACLLLCFMITLPPPFFPYTPTLYNRHCFGGGNKLQSFTLSKTEGIPLAQWESVRSSGLNPPLNGGLPQA